MEHGWKFSSQCVKWQWFKCCDKKTQAEVCYKVRERNTYDLALLSSWRTNEVWRTFLKKHIVSLLFKCLLACQ